ncbi:MAG TPA: glycosyltransferase family 4 protein [bacterium]|nr:glycosyltransferase family 4 protein [bacterium]HOL34286.1 glycosyltransferase family 4 protein [bacterium]HPP07658.1 glycosyltransferase family 4 protein [bacterium]
MKVFLMVPEMNLGGVEEGSFDLACGMKKMGVDVTIISGPGSYIPLIEKEDIRWFNLPMNKKTPVIFWKSLRILQKLIADEKPDILHCRSRFPAWIGYYALARYQKTRFITSIHGFYSPSYYSKIMGRGERVIVISNTLGEFAIKKLGAHPDRVRVVHNGIKFEPYVSLPRKQHSGFIIGGIGRLTKLKGFQYLIRAAAIARQNAPHIKIHIIGDGPYKKHLESLGKKLGIEVLFLQGRASDYLPEIDLLVAPHIETETLRKGIIPWLGRSVYEAQLAGVPVLTTLNGIEKERFIKTETELLTAPCDIEAMAKAIEFVIQYPEELNHMVINAKEFVINHFSIQQMVEKTVKVYQELL